MHSTSALQFMSEHTFVCRTQIFQGNSLLSASQIRQSIWWGFLVWWLLLNYLNYFRGKGWQWHLTHDNYNVITTKRFTKGQLWRVEWKCDQNGKINNCPTYDSGLFASLYWSWEHTRRKCKHWNNTIPNDWRWGEMQSELQISWSK